MEVGTCAVDRDAASLIHAEGINSGSVVNTISIALLVAGRPSDATCEATGGRGYVGMFEPLFERALSSIPRYHYHQKKKLHFRAFDVTRGELPEEGQLGDGLWDALLVTGSRAYRNGTYAAVLTSPADSVTANAPWMDALMRFLVHVAEDHPLVRILGICFGHQLVARAFGGRVERNPAGAVLGVEKCQLTELGHELLAYDENSYMMIEQFHWDHVAEAPGAFQGTQFELLASSERTPVEALSLSYPTEAPPLPSIAGTSAYVAFDVDDTCAKAAGPMPVRSTQVLTLQGHPEFDTATVQRELAVLHEAGQIDRKTFDTGMGAAARPHDGMHLACIILGMLGVEPASGTEDL